MGFLVANKSTSVFERLLESTLNDLFLNVWFSILGGLIGGLVGNQIAPGLPSILVGAVLGFILTVALHYFVVAHYLGKEITECVKKLSRQHRPVKRFYKEWIGDECRSVADELQALHSGGVAPKYDLRFQLRLIDHYLSGQTSVSECYQVWSHRLFPVDKYYKQSIVVGYLRAFENHYQKVQNDKRRFLLMSPADYSTLSSSFPEWTDFVDYHKRNSVKLIYVPVSEFDAEIVGLRYYLEDFCFILSRKLSWAMGTIHFNNNRLVCKTDAKLLGDLKTLVTRLSECRNAITIC